MKTDLLQGIIVEKPKAKSRKLKAVGVRIRNLQLLKRNRFSSPEVEDLLKRFRV